MPRGTGIGMQQAARANGWVKASLVVGLALVASGVVAELVRAPTLSVENAAKLDPGRLLERLELGPEPLVLISSSSGRRAVPPFVEFALWPDGRCLSLIDSISGAPDFLECTLPPEEAERLASAIYERAEPLDGGSWGGNCPIPLRIAARRGVDVAAFDVESYLCIPRAIEYEREKNPAWPAGDIYLSAEDLALVRGYLEIDALLEQPFHAPAATPARLSLTLGPVPEPWWQFLIDLFR